MVTLPQMSDVETLEDLPPVAHATIAYLGPVSPHWELRGHFGEEKMLDDFWARVHARLLLLPKHDPQFRRNRERVNRDAERELIRLDWDLGDEEPARQPRREQAPAPVAEAAPPVEAVEAEPVEAEPVEAESVEAELVEAEPVEAEPVEAEPVEEEAVEAEVEAPEAVEADAPEADAAEAAAAEDAAPEAETAEDEAAPAEEAPAEES